MKKNVIIAIVCLVAGLVAGYFAGRCCCCCNSCDNAQVPDKEVIETIVNEEIASQTDTLDSVEVHSVRVVTTTPENLQQTISEEVGKALKDAKQMYKKTKQQTDDK